ncbi:MAG: hypothetical protein V3V61_03720 [Gammaproteobacteria bacterium]
MVHAFFNLMVPAFIVGALFNWQVAIIAHLVWFLFAWANDPSRQYNTKEMKKYDEERMLARLREYGC